MRAQWVNALIIKVVGKTMGYHFISLRVMSLWKPSGRMDCVEMEKCLFLLHFSLKEDYERVLKDGPWFVGGHYLSIRNWEPNLNHLRPASHLLSCGYVCRSYLLSTMSS